VVAWYEAFCDVIFVAEYLSFYLQEIVLLEERLIENYSLEYIPLILSARQNIVLPLYLPNIRQLQ